MNKLGRNKTLWLKNQGCQFVDDEQGHTNIYTAQGEYVGLADLGEYDKEINFIYKHRITQLSSLNRAQGKPLSKTGCNAVSIGFSEKEQAWFGWSHRGHGKFYVGFEVVEGTICDCGDHKYPYKVETLEQARQLAIFIADWLD